MASLCRCSCSGGVELVGTAEKVFPVDIRVEARAVDRLLKLVRRQLQLEAIAHQDLHPALFGGLSTLKDAPLLGVLVAELGSEGLLGRLDGRHGDAVALGALLPSFDDIPSGWQGGHLGGGPRPVDVGCDHRLGRDHWLWGDHCFGRDHRLWLDDGRRWLLSVAVEEGTVAPDPAVAPASRLVRPS